jgi:hypothetical protein
MSCYDVMLYLERSRHSNAPPQVQHSFLVCFLMNQNSHNYLESIFPYISSSRQVCNKFSIYCIFRPCFLGYSRDLF